jgi:hypothetical protein
MGPDRCQGGQLFSGQLSISTTSHDGWILEMFAFCV